MKAVRVLVVDDSATMRGFIKAGGSDAATSAEHGGFGLGLSIVRRLAIALDHPIDLASRIGHGSVFAISAPLDSAQAILPIVRSNDAALANYGLDSARVLMIENEPSVAQAMKSLLERWGCGVIVAASCDQARKAVREHQPRPDLIIADLHLENGELGFDAIRSIQTEFNMPIPAFIVTADHSEGVTAAAAAMGVEVLRKPVKPAELRSLMAYLLA